MSIAQTYLKNGTGENVCAYRGAGNWENDSVSYRCEKVRANHDTEKGCGCLLCWVCFMEWSQTFESKENAKRYKSQITLAKRRIKAID